MARYKKPTDPRPELADDLEQESIPWRWLGLGVLAALLALALSLWLASLLLRRPPLETGMPPATVIRLTAPASTTPSPTRPLPTPTTIPTLTPLPTPDLALPPPEVTVGYFAAVANTENVGVTVRGGPNVTNLTITTLPEGELVFVSGGPEEGSGLQWWQVRLADETFGWIAADFLIPAAAPRSGFEAIPEETTPAAPTEPASNG